MNYKILAIFPIILGAVLATLPTSNPYLASSAWPTSHQNSYCTDSSVLRGPELDDLNNIDIDFLWGLKTIAPITLVYSDDGSTIWGSSVTDILKIDVSQDELQIISKYRKDNVLSDWQFHGAYPSLGNDGSFYVSTKDRISVYSNEETGNISSGIKLIGEYVIDGFAADEYIVGLTMSYDGWLIWGSNTAKVGAVHHSLTKASNILQLPGDSSVLAMSNSFAVDEFGNIYMVTNLNMQGLKWDDETFSINWVYNYNNDTTTRFPGRLGTGSGSTPTIMSTNGKRYIVITDGMSPMHILFFNADTGTLVANETVTFDDTNQSTSEQSVVVNDNKATVVNNWYGNVSCPEFLYKIAPIFMEEMCPIFKGIAPLGVRQFEIDSETDTVTSTWLNNEVSCPNGIPTMSSTSNIFYCIGKREDIGWTLEALDWNSGESLFHVDLGFGWEYNSNYAAAEIGPNREIISGTMLGIVRIQVSN